MLESLGLLAILITLVLLAWVLKGEHDVARLVRSLQEQHGRDAQRLFDLLIVRLPQPTLTEVRAEAKRMARQIAAEKRITALHALHRAASRLGDRWSSDLDDENLTATDLGELERHFKAAALIAQGYDPTEAAKRELLGRDCLGVTESELALLSTGQRERAKRLADKLGKLDLPQIEKGVVQDLIRRGALTKGASPSAGELDSSNFAFLVALAISKDPPALSDSFTDVDALFMKQFFDRFGDIPPPPTEEDLARLSEEQISLARRLAKELTRGEQEDEPAHRSAR